MKTIELETDSNKKFNIDVPLDAKNIKVFETTTEILIYFHTKFDGKKYLPTYTSIKL